MNPRKYNVDELLKDGQPVQFPITGWSMYPFLSDGDLVTVAPIDPTTLKVGDVVLYRREHGPLILHRLIKITQ